MNMKKVNERALKNKNNLVGVTIDTKKVNEKALKIKK